MNIPYNKQILTKKNEMKKALIIVDPQNDFCDFFQDAPLGVKDSQHIFPIINQLKKMDKFNNVFITLDWHPANHSSFAINHGVQPFSEVMHLNQKQMLWPIHCVQGSQGAKPSKLLKIQKNDIFVKKGMIQSEQQYSGFGTKTNPTKLLRKLKNLGIQSVVVVGLAFDYCVGSTALDAREAGFQTVIIKEGTKAVSQQTAELMLEKLKQKEIQVISFRNFE